MLAACRRDQFASKNMRISHFSLTGCWAIPQAKAFAKKKEAFPVFLNRVADLGSLGPVNCPSECMAWCLQVG
jgi:hypothetical protein